MTTNFYFKSNFARRTIAVALTTALVSVIPTYEAAQLPAAANGPSIALYFSAPFVQGTHVSGAGVLKENFNSFTGNAACPSTTGVGALSGTGCKISTDSGAGSDTGDQVVGVALSRYAQTNGTMNSTYTFANPVKFVGFWWMMGSNGNTVEFLDSDNNVIASFASEDIMDFFGVSYASLTSSDTGTVTRVDGLTHPRRYYFRNPQNYGALTNGVPATTPNYSADTYANEPWVYLNLFVSGSLSVSKLRLTGTNFEYDNIAVSTNVETPRNDMVLVFQKDVPTITWAPNTNLLLGSSPTTPAAATSSGNGAVTYSVKNAGTSGCTVNLNTGAITYTALGTCVITATSAETSTYFSATKDISFTVGRATQTVTWAPTTALLTTDSPATPSAAATTSGDGSITYAVTDAGTSGCSVDANTGVLTYTAIGSCTVRATAAQTATYSSASADVVFTIAELYVPPRSVPYEGPLNLRIQTNSICSGGELIVTGTRLATIQSVEIGSKPADFELLADGRLKVSLKQASAGKHSIKFWVPVNNVNLTDQIQVGSCSSSSTTQITAAPGTFEASRLFANYRGDRGPVIARDRAAITAFINQYKGITNVRCVGSTSGVPAKRTDPALATARAKNACDVVKRLVPNATISLETSTGKGIGQRFRSVTIFISGTN